MVFPPPGLLLLLLPAPAIAEEEDGGWDMLHDFLALLCRIMKIVVVVVVVVVYVYCVSNQVSKVLEDVSEKISLFRGRQTRLSGWLLYCAVER